MKHAEKIALENALQTHYQEIRRTEMQPSDQARQALLAQSFAAQTAEQERERSRFPTREPAPQGTAFDFVMTAARFLPWQLWGAPAAAVLVAALAAAHGLSSSQILVTLSGLGPALAIACLYGITRARSHGMAEIEAACSHGSIALASARLTLLCSASLRGHCRRLRVVQRHRARFRGRNGSAGPVLARICRRIACGAQGGSP